MTLRIYPTKEALLKVLSEKWNLAETTEEEESIGHLIDLVESTSAGFLSVEAEL